MGELNSVKEWILRRKWAVALAGMASAAIPLAFMAIFINLMVTRVITSRIEDESANLAILAARHVEDKLDADLAKVGLFATRPLLIDAVEQQDSRTVLQHLKMLLNNSNSIERVFVTTKEGVEFVSLPENKEVYGKDFSHRDWYKGVSQNWKHYVSEFYQRTALPPRYLFSLAVPVLKDEKVVGVLVMQPKENYISAAFENINFGGSSLYIVDKNQSLISLSNTATGELAKLSGASFVEKLVRGEGGAEITDSPIYKIESLIAYQPIK